MMRGGSGAVTDPEFLRAGFMADLCLTGVIIYKE